MRRRFLLLAAVYFLLTSCSPIKAATGSQAQGILSQQLIGINEHSLLVEIAKTGQERRAGLAHRTTLGPNKGMLFVFTSSRIRFFTTAQTTLALSIAFLDENGIILDIQQMQPLKRSSYRSKFEARFALEVNHGWFEKNNVEMGDKVSLPKIF